MSAVTVDPGLAGVIVADTRISEVDGEAGSLILRGLSLDALAALGSVEAAAAHLLDQPPSQVHEQLASGRGAAFAELDRVRPALSATDGMDALRGALGSLPPGIHPTAAAAVCFAAWTRLQRGLEPVAPNPELPLAADLVRTVLGEVEPARAQALGTYLVTVAEHGLNASTFTARVVASTGSDELSAVVAAIGALKGPLHGGAPGPVLDMLDAIGSPDRAATWLRAELDAGRRIMGFGHRVYRVRDPRAAVLESAAARLGAGGSNRLGLAREVERAATRLLCERHPTRPLRANVEFATAVLLDAIGWQRTWFAPTFAVGRTVGWLAHIAEQRATGRLIRPAARYVGPR